MPARMFCKTGALRGAAFDIAEEATIGSGGDNTIVLSATTVSRQHARIFFDADRRHYVVEDLGSRNGTRVDGARVRGDERLDDLSVVTFAESHDFIFQRLDEGHALASIELSADKAESGAMIVANETLHGSDEAIVVPKFGEPEVTVSEPPGMATPTELGATRVVLELELTEGLWTRFELVEGANTLGRSRDCPISIDNDKLSRKHAVLTVASESVKVRDLETTNRTYVDGERISTEVEIDADTALRFGPIRGRLLWER